MVTFTRFDRQARLLAGCAALALAAPTLAQEQAAEAAAPAPATATAEASQTDDVIVVTGSRIPRPDVEGIIPGAQITSQEIQSRGFTSILEALNDNPLVGPGASPIGNAGGQPASLGAAFVDLLDLGTNRTLSLVNGRRFVSGNAGSLFVAGNVTGSQVDLNVIPTELVERTDVLTVGGAVAYGSDAISGVVNIILKDDYEGLAASIRSGVSDEGDLFNYQVSGVFGTNFAGGRGNIAMSVQYNRDDGLQAGDRDEYNPSYVAPTFFRNGNVRNSKFAPAIPIDVTGANNGAFLRSTDDGVPGTQLLPLVTGGSILISDGGNVFQFTATALPAGLSATSNGVVYGNQTASIQNLAGTTQIVPGGGVSGATANGLSGNIPAVGNAATLAANQFTRFAPTALPPGVTAASVIAALAPGFNTSGATAAQLTTLAVNLLQANRPTPREYLAANPNTPINAFLGSFLPAYLDVPNTDAASAAFLPRTAVPLRFDSAGALVPYVPAVIGANTPATVGGAPGGDFYNSTRYTVIRTQQDRIVGNLIGHYDLTPNLRFFTENLVARVENLALRNSASSNGLGGGATETAVLAMNLNNPFLTAAARTTLINAGVPTTGPTAGFFLLSRTNQDITGNNEAYVNTTTFRTVNGLKGDFGLFGRDFRFDAAVSYGRSKAKVGTISIRDVEYALALDAVTDPSNPNRIICRVQLPGASTALPLGVINTVLVREPGPDGVLVEKIVPRTVTPQQVSGCQPLNPFGVNQMSQASKDYVLFRGVAQNVNEQYGAQASLATPSLFELPGGGAGFAINAEWRRETGDYSPSADQRLGASRTAALAATSGSITSLEGSVEARLPIFGEDFSFPLMKSLEFTPGVRFVKQTGDAPDVRRLNGALETNEAKGSWESLWTLGGTWQPIEDVRIRGNVTRSLRQPSGVELFLGNQPAFNTPTDPCSNANIGSGNFPANRRANCEQEVVRLGIAPDRAQAANFLNTYVPAGVSLQGGFAGSPALKPEKGKSWTVGAVFTPRFIPGLTLAVDYLSVTVRNQIIPTTLSNAAQFCYDSPTFGDTTAQLGVNTCSFFDREPTTAGGSPQFNLRNGFASGFINLGALQVKAVNATARYSFELADLLGGADKGTLTFNASAYRLLDYINLPAGDFSDSQNSAGSFFRPKWKTQLTTRYSRDKFYSQLTWNWQNATGLFNFNLGSFNMVEQTDVFRFPSVSLFDATVGYDVNDNFGLQLVVRNLGNKQYAGARGFGNAASSLGAQGEVDILGRRYQLTARMKF